MASSKTTSQQGRGRIKNYTSELEVEESLAIIRRSLTQHKARRITFENDDQGQTVGLIFEMLLAGQRLTFRVPARFERVRVLVEQALREAHLSRQNLDEQTQRTAWANIKDWVLAQMALIDIEMVKMEEVFFPYLVQGKQGQTVFEAFEQQLALPEPQSTGSYRYIEEG